MGDIYIEEPILESQRLISPISVSPSLEKYLKNKELFLEYDAEIFANDSILNIPLTATVLPLAWLTGSDIHVEVLDRSFKESMEKLQTHFAEIYREGSFTTKIDTNRLIDNKINAGNPDRRTGLLFSGGVDSTYSLIKNLEKNPRLIMIWGCDNFPYPEHADHWEKTIKTYKSFAVKQNLDINIIKTNMNQILNDPRIEHKFHKELYDGNIREALQHSLILLPAAAPLAIHRFDHFIIAASFMQGLDFNIYPRAALPVSDEKIAWANLNVEHHGFLDRTEKIIEICNFMEDDYLQLRVCVKSKLTNGKLNCTKCEKCIRTFLPIMFLGIDPNLCGFNVDESTFETIRSFWEQKHRPLVPYMTYRRMRDMIPTQMDYSISGSKEFINWFREFEFPPSTKNWFYTDLYMSLPYPLAQLLHKLYRKLGINIKAGPNTREQS